MVLIDELVHFITNGSVLGLPSLAVMTVPLVIGIIVGFFTIKFLKILVIAAVIIAAATFFGFYSMDIPALQQMVQLFGSMAMAIGSLLLGMMPLSVGLVIGVIIGVILG
jgi:hypothetical protein